MLVTSRVSSSLSLNHFNGPDDTYTVQSGDTLSRIAARHNMSLNELITSNPQISNPDIIFSGEIINIGRYDTADISTQPDTYTVQTADTLTGIAKDHAVTLDALIAANRQISNPNIIFPGELINIPISSHQPSPAEEQPTVPVEPIDPSTTDPGNNDSVSGEFNYNLITGVEDNTHVTGEFIAEVEALADRLETQPEYLLAVMSFESAGTFRPDITNSIGATGLIQFLPSTAAGLGTSTDKLRGMSSVEQLEFVEKYFQQPHFENKLGSVEGLYSAVLSGQATPDPDDTLTNFMRGRPAYESNAALDFNNDGRITSGEASSAVVSRLYGGVRNVQQLLLAAGVVPAGQQTNFADGSFGPHTQAAIRSFQEQNSLPATGYLSDATGRLLLSIDNNTNSSPENAMDLQFSEAIHERETPGRQYIDSPVIGSFTITEGFMARGGPHSSKSERLAVFADNPTQTEVVPAGVYNLGIDYVTHNGRIDSWFDGEVVDIQYSNTGYGNRLIMRSDLLIEYQGQQYPVYAHYAHADGFTVQEGERISAGQDIGDQGSTGHSTGDHVDFHTWIDAGGQRITISPNILAQGDAVLA